MDLTDSPKVKAWHSMASGEVLKQLETSPDGLASEEALRRLEAHGPNELQREKRASPFRLFLNQFKNTLMVILIAATLLSIVVGETVDALIIAVIVVFSAVLGFFQEYRAERALEALKKMLSHTVSVLRDGREHEIDAKLLVPGDMLLLEAGDRVAADCRVIESASLRCDEAPLTGESAPVSKSVAPVAHDLSLPDRKNMVYTGSVITYGRAKAAVAETGMNTEFGRIAKEVASVKTEKTPLEKRTEEIGRWLGTAAISICALVIGISLIRELSAGTFSLQSAVKMVMFGVALAVAAVPEALAAIVTGALAIGMHEMAKKNALIRKMPAVETLGSATVICTDKTGTLTKGEMTLRRLFVSGRYVNISGVGYVPEGEFTDAGSSAPLRADEFKGGPLEMFIKCGLLCNDSDLREHEGRWLIKGDPTEAALVVAAVKAGLSQHEVRIGHPRLSEVPFSSERKMMTTVHATPEGVKLAFIKGAPEVVLERCTHQLKDKGAVPVMEEEKALIRNAAAGMASNALRVLALAYREVEDVNAGEADEEKLEHGLVFLGLAGMMDPPRPEAIEAVRVCKEVHVKPVMITGDHKITALSIAKEMGIYSAGDIVLAGEEIERLSDEELEAVVDKVTVYARVSPSDKMKIVKAWKKRGEVVAMTGDGVNDAPALKHADIGIAMGITGTEVAKEAADMVLSDDNFATIVSAIERGRWIFENIKKYLTYLLRCNITEVIVIGGVVLALGPEYLPLLPAAILYINLATDGLPALALGVSPPDPDLMKRPPRDPRASVFSGEVKTFILMAVAVETPLFLLAYFLSLPDMGLARTRMFFMFILVEIAIALNFSSMRFSIFKVRPHKWLVLALLWEVLLIAALVQIPSVREAFGIDMPRAADVAAMLGICMLMIFSMEIAKAVLRRRLLEK